MGEHIGRRSVMDVLMDRITRDPAVLGGKPVVGDDRVPVDRVLDLLTAGISPEAILLAHPGLEIADIGACLAYARRDSS